MQNELPPIKSGDIVKLYSGKCFEVIQASLCFNDVKQYDSTGAGQESADERVTDNFIFVAVKDPKSNETYVYLYGDGGVEKEIA